MAQPRRPKGESGPAKSSKHLQKAIDSGLLDDNSRMSALESLLGAAATNSSSSAAKKTGKKSSQKDQGDANQESQQTQEKSPKFNKKKSNQDNGAAAASVNEVDDSNITATPVSAITSDEILALFAKIDKTKTQVNDLQQQHTVLRAIATLVSIYSVPAANTQNENTDGSKDQLPPTSMVRATSAVSSADSTAVAAGSRRSFTPDAVVAPTVVTFCEHLQHHAYHPSVVVRRGLAQCLSSLLSRGSEVRQEVGGAIAKTFAPWLALIGDQVNGEVSRPAKEALEKTFPAGSAKRAQLFSKFGARACKKLLDDLAQFLNTGRGDFVLQPSLHHSKNNTNNSNDDEGDNNNSNNNVQHALRDTGDSATGIAVGQIFGALTFLASEIGNNSSNNNNNNNNNKLSNGASVSAPEKDPFIQVRSDVCVLMAATLGFALPAAELLEMETENSTSFIATLSRTASIAFGATASNGGDGSNNMANNALSFSQKKMKNKAKAAGASGKSDTHKPEEGAAVFGASSSNNYCDPAPSASIMLPASSTTDFASSTSFLQQQPFFNVIAKKCLPSIDGTSKSVIATSVRLQQTVWVLMMDLIQLVSRVVSSSSSNNLAKSTEYILDFLPKVMTASLFVEEASSEQVQSAFAVQQAFWSSLISCLHGISCSSSQLNPTAISFLSKSLRTIFWPCVMDVLDNVAEGDIKILPVPLFDALSSFVLLLQKTSATPQEESSSFLSLQQQDPKSIELLKSIFDKLIKVANREFDSWKKSSLNNNNNTAAASSNFMNSMRASIEFTGTVLHLLLTESGKSSTSAVVASSLAEHCVAGLTSFFSNEKLHSLFQAENLVEEILKLPASLASTISSVKKNFNNHNASSSASIAAKMFLDISDRFAGWALLAAKNSSSSSSDTIMEIIGTQATSANEIVAINLHLQLVKRWMNLESSSDEMTKVASQSLEALLSMLNAHSSTFNSTSRSLHFHIAAWFLREFAAAVSLASTTRPALASRTSIVSEKLFSSENMLSSLIKASANDKDESSNGETFVKTLTRILLACPQTDGLNKKLMESFSQSSILSNGEESRLLSIIDSISQVLQASNNNNNNDNNSNVGILCEILLANIIKKVSSSPSSTSISLINKIIKKLKLHKILNNNLEINNNIQSLLWNWLETQSQSLSSSDNISSFEAILETAQSLLQLNEEDANNNKEQESSSCLKVLTSLVDCCLLPLASKSGNSDSFLFVSDEVKEALQGNDSDDDEEVEETEETEEEEEAEVDAKKEENLPIATFDELRAQFDQHNQTFLRLFESWASVCDEIPGGSALIVDLASQLESQVVASKNNGKNDDVSGHIPLLAVSVRASRFPSQLASGETWKQLIEDSSSSASSTTSANAFFSLLQLLETESAKRFSIHDFAVAQFPLSNLLDFAQEASGVSVSSLSNVGRLIVSLAESIHATGFKTEIERDYEREQQEEEEAEKHRKKSRRSGSGDNDDDEEVEEEEEEEEEEDDDDESDYDEKEMKKHSQHHGNNNFLKSSLPAPDAAVGTKLILPVMQMLSIRNLWSAKVRESLKFILSWCLECLLPAQNNNNTASSPNKNDQPSSPASPSFLNSSAVSGLAQSCISICVNYSERAPFLLTGPLALLAQMYTTTKDVRYDRLLRAIYSSVANAWAMDVWRFSPVCFSPWPGSALDSLLWSALMPRGVSLPKEALDKLRRAIAMSPVGAAATSAMTAEEKSIRAIHNGIHAMHLLSLLPENVAHSAAASPIEVNHVVQAMRSISLVARPLASSAPEKSKQTFIAGLAVFAALSRCIVLSPGALPEVAANAVNCLTQAYKLEVLPPAGKFAFQQQQTNQEAQQQEQQQSASPSSDSSPEFLSKEESSRKIIQALSALRHGVKAHLYKDDGLTSTMNLCVLDIGCSLGAQLQKYAASSNNDAVDEEQEAEEQRLLLVAYDVSKFLSSDFLSPDDLRALRASAATVAPIARFVIGTHFWLCSRPLKLFSFEEFVAKATTILNLAAQLAVSILIGCRPLIKNQTIMSSFVAIFARSPLRAMNGRQQAVQEVAKLEQQHEAEKTKQLLHGGPEVQPMSDRSKLARVLAIPQKQLSLSAFKRHANFLVTNAKMRVTGISYFVLSYVYLSLSDDPSVSDSLSSIAVVQAADLMLCGLNLKDSQSGKLIFECPVETTTTNSSSNKKKKSKRNTNNNKNNNKNKNATLEEEVDEESMSQFLQVSKIADPRWLQPAAKSPVVGPAQLRSQFGRWAATCFGLLIQRPVIATLRHWREGLHHTARDALNGFIETHFSPYLSKMALIDVLAHAPVGDLNTLMERDISAFHPAEEFGGDRITIEVDRSARVVTVRFHTDEIETRIAVRVPTGYPLSTAQITDKDIGIKGVSEAKRRSWLLRMSASLLMGSSSLWSVVEMFCTNLAKEFEGVEPCPICYMITSGNELPSMQCKVCKNAKFHKSCLTQWWATAPQSICPMCRSPWFAV